MARSHLWLALLSQPGVFVFNDTVSADVTNYNLRNRAIAAGWDQVLPLRAVVTINSGIYVSANATGTHAFDRSGSFPAGSLLVLTNNGFIVGMGGAGATPQGATGKNGVLFTGGVTGGTGGPALSSGLVAEVTNNGTIAGGGGGGGSGAPTASGSATAGERRGSQGGAGGGGRSGRTNSAAGPNVALNTVASQGVATAAQAGTATAAGNGGTSTVDVTDGVTRGGNGGAGGAWGATGTAGGAAIAPGTGGGGTPQSAGAGGAAVNGNSNITWLVTGTRLGAINA